MTLRNQIESEFAFLNSTILSAAHHKFLDISKCRFDLVDAENSILKLRRLLSKYSLEEEENEK